MIAVGAAMAFASTAVSAQQMASALAANLPSYAHESEQHTGTALETPVSVTLSNVTLDAALREVARVSGVRVAYTPAVVPVDRRVSIAAEKKALGDVLKTLLQGTNAQVQLSPVGRVMIVPASSGHTEAQGTISGRVVDAKTKRPIAGATVSIGSTTHSVVTADDGSFRIIAPAGEQTVNVRALGFVRKIVKVVLSDGETQSIEVSLEASASVLNEVIVTGTVVATARKEIPTPITVIKAEDIERRGITRIEQLFRGEVPGVMALEQGTAVYGGVLGAMASAEVYVRGASGFNPEVGTTPLKTYVDGIELLDPAYLGTIDPQSIERIEIITGPQAATIYGSGALGGVMQIFTKKGSGGAPDLTLTVKYGTLESDFSNGLTPSHNHSLNIAGGSGSEFSYSANLSYTYTGQWQPMLFNRRYGMQGGVTHRRGPFAFQGSVSVTKGTNGTYGVASPFARLRRSTGEQLVTTGSFSSGLQITQRISGAYGQTLGLTIDYQPTAMWQNQLTIGRSHNIFELVPEAPIFKEPSDSLFRSEAAHGNRTSVSYNSSVYVARAEWLSSTLSFGGNGSWAANARITGTLSAKTSSSLESPTVRKSGDDQNSGAFVSWRIGFLQNIFATIGIRAEQNPRYGKDHKIDWTPTNGVAYTMQWRDATVKVLASYGMATRPPTLGQTEAQWVRGTWRAPYDYYLNYFEAPELRPEYERGPQGGIEVYYGNLSSVTINTYSQRVSDLILPVVVDSFYYTWADREISGWHYQQQNRNLAEIRKRGWEATGTLNLGPASLRGVYSWNDSRTKSINGGSINLVQWVGANIAPGSSFINVPTHNGSFSASYAHGSTRVALVSNFVGKVIVRYVDGEETGIWASARLKEYRDHAKQNSAQQVRPGYIKTDISMAHRLTPWANATMNITNVGNSYASQATASLGPALGRQTMFGLSLRWP